MIFQSTSDSSVPWLDGHTYRMHRFRSSASPIKGLTADIMVRSSSNINPHHSTAPGQISVAVAAYNKSPTYERYAPDQLIGFASMWEAVRMAENRMVAEAAAQISGA
jgi:peroxisomal coenzyme A diphosphatase NUDT7